MSEIFNHELNIKTNDGWVVTLVSDRPIDLGDIRLSSIIVQPAEDFDRRIQKLPACARERKEYRMQPGGES